jgi:hypothetical protein
MGLCGFGLSVLEATGTYTQPSRSKRECSIFTSMVKTNSIWSSIIVVCLILACSSENTNGIPIVADSGTTQDAQARMDGSVADGAVSNCPLPATPDTGSTKLLSIMGEPADPDGIFDPSILYPAGATAGLMVYSSISGKVVHTRLAASNDSGATWAYLSDVNTAAPARITTTDMAVCGAATCDGTWVYETPSVVIDIDEPERLLKVFVHRYFLSAMQGLRYDIGGISMFSAKAPMGPWTESKVIGWNSSSPSSSIGATQNASTDPMLSGVADCFLLTEPGALIAPITATPSALHLAVGCVRIITKENTPIEIRLLRSLDHGASWRYVSTLLNAADAATFGAVKRQFNAPNLYAKNGKLYLFASPDGPIAIGNAGASFGGYRGCLGFAVDDLETGTLKRCEGKPTVSASLPGIDKRFLGACTYAEGATKLGVLAGDLEPLGAPQFRIMTTGRAPSASL